MKIKVSNIIVTGAASGFGREISIKLSSEGANIYALDIDKKGLESLKKTNSNITTFICDVTDSERIKEIVEKIFDLNNKINVLINNAGIMINSPLINLFDSKNSLHSEELFEKVIRVNLLSVFKVTRVVVFNMIKNRNKGVIINIGSIASNGNAGQTAYSASKAGVSAMSKVWSKELGAFGIRSVEISPGFIDTKGTHNAIEEKALKNWVMKTPIKRTGKIEEIVEAIRFSITNDFFNGESINLNGGLII